jgi:hypothetical protein
MSSVNCCPRLPGISSHQCEHCSLQQALLERLDRSSIHEPIDMSLPDERMGSTISFSSQDKGHVGAEQDRNFVANAGVLWD